MMKFRSINLIPLTIAVVFIASCENPFSTNEVQLDSSELEEFSNNLEIELGLSGKNTNTLRKALGRHGGKGRSDKDPGFLWKIAAELQETLSDEAKEKIFSRLNKAKKYSKDLMDQGPKDRGMGNKDPFGAIQKILTEDQKKEFDLIMANHRTEITSLVETVQSGEITREEGENMIKELEESLKNSIDALLSDKQKAQLEKMKEELEAKKKAFAEQVELAKMKALELTNDQNDALDGAKEKLKNQLDGIKVRIGLGELSREEGRIAEKTFFEAYKEATFNILTDKQVEIIKIHGFLAMRWHSKVKNRGDGDKDGRGGRGG